MRALVVLMLVCGVAYAEPPGLTPATSREAPAPAKSVSSAMWMTLGTTLGGLAAFVVGENLQRDTGCGDGCAPGSLLSFAGGLAFLVGPTTGHAYAGHVWNTGLGLRLGGVVAFGLGAIGMIPCLATAKTVDGSHQPGTNCTLGVIGLTGGAIAFTAGTVVEIATVPGAVRDYNRAHAGAPVVTFAPIATPRGMAPGVAVAGQF